MHDFSSDPYRKPPEWKTLQKVRREGGGYLTLAQPLHHLRQRRLVHRRHRLLAHLLHQPTQAAAVPVAHRHPLPLRRRVHLAQDRSASAGPSVSRPRSAPCAAGSTPPSAAVETSAAPSPRSRPAPPQSPVEVCIESGAAASTVPAPARSAETAHSVPCQASYHKLLGRSSDHAPSTRAAVPSDTLSG